MTRSALQALLDLHTLPALLHDASGILMTNAPFDALMATARDRAAESPHTLDSLIKSLPTSIGSKTKKNWMKYLEEDPTGELLVDLALTHPPYRFGLKGALVRCEGREAWMVVLTAKDHASTTTHCGLCHQGQAGGGLGCEFLQLHQSRIVGLQETIRWIAHHWRQPLTTINFIAEEILDLYDEAELERDALKHRVDTIVSLCFTLSHTIENFRAYFVPDRTREEFLLEERLQKTLEVLAPGLHEDRIELKVIGMSQDATRHTKIRGHADELGEVLLSLITNARDSILRKREETQNPKMIGSILLHIAQLPGKVTLAVRDNGRGFAPGVQERLFMPYATTKHPGEGVGLSLFMAKLLIERQLGGVIFARELERGAEFVIELPTLPS